MNSAICPQCFRVTDAATGKCTHCDFPLDKDPELYAECWGCQRWFLIAELAEDTNPDRGAGWYCDECREEREARHHRRDDYEARLIESERRYDAAKDDMLTEGGRT